jgi:hypothetical protein
MCSSFLLESCFWPRVTAPPPFIYKKYRLVRG